MHIFISYYIIAGLLTLLWFWYDMNSNDEEAEDTIADITWNTGIKREYIRALLYALALLFGWLILPYEVISRFIGKEEI